VEIRKTYEIAEEYNPLTGGPEPVSISKSKELAPINEEL